MNGHYYGNTLQYKVGDEVMLEVNMNAFPHTLHFFRNGIQEKPFFTNIPPSLKFAVFFSLFPLIHLFLFL
jgi:hypothetical protein